MSVFNTIVTPLCLYLCLGHRLAANCNREALKLLVDSDLSRKGVGKMSAKDEGVEREPHRNRTCNLLIKSQLLCQLS